MPIETVRVELLGASFAIQTDESAEYVESLIAHLRSTIETVKASSKVEEPLKAAILAGVFLADELRRSKDGVAASQPAIDLGEVADRLIAKIDDSLEAER